jgi:hypothetical protein
VLAASCVLPALDLAGRPCPCAADYVCDTASNTCVPAGSTSTATGGSAGTGGGPGGHAGQGAGGPGGTAGTGGAGGTAGTGGAGGEEPLAKPLVMAGDVGTGQVELSVEGFFTLVTESGSNWQPARWYDLATDPAADLSGKMPGNPFSNLFISPYSLEVNTNWYEGDDGTVLDVTVTDQTPARVVIDTLLGFPAPNVEVHAVYHVYASGRVSVTADVVNAGATPLPVDDAEVNTVSLAEPLNWAATTFASSQAAGFFRTDGLTPYPNLLVVNTSLAGVYGQDYADNCFWTQGPFNLPGGGQLPRTGEVQLGPGGQDAAALASRVNDLVVPGLQVPSGGSPVASGYDLDQGAYVLQASATTVQFRPTNAAARHSPAFVVTNWSSPTWTVSLNGEALVSNAAPIGHHAIAFFDQAGSTLVLVYLRDIPMAAPDAERLFTLEAQ